jgi:nucleoside-diphosphate-sugar epimerase
MKILVMGGTEFVSRNVAEHFINENYVVDIFTRGHREVPYKGYRKHIIGDRHVVEDLKQLDSYDYIVDISAYTKIDVELLTNTVDTTELKRYIFCSSGAVYKPNSHLITEADDVGENHNWRKYGLDKLEAEQYLESSGLPYSIFRPTYIYGPNNNLYRESYFFDRLTTHQKVKYPNSSSETQFLHIHDLCLIIQSMLANKKSLNQAYNVTHDEVLDFKSILEVFEEVTGLVMEKECVNTNEQPISRKYFPYRDVTYKLSIDKLRKHGLHVPKFDLLNGLKQTFKWYQETQPELSDKAMIDIDS